MKISDLRRSISKHHEEDVHHSLMTPFGEKIQKMSEEEKAKLFSEYPRPQLRRKAFMPLNGYWNYAIVDREREHRVPAWQGKILVPFSPEAELSGVGHILQPEEELWYERALPDSLLQQEKHRGQRLLLHFGAVDQRCAVYLNRKKVDSHVGGYLPFTLDITEYLAPGDNRLMVVVRDETDASYHARGKQTRDRGGMFYTPQSGIWQSVWAEWVPETYIQNIQIQIGTDLKTAVLDVVIRDCKEQEGQRRTPTLSFRDEGVEIVSVKSMDAPKSAWDVYGSRQGITYQTRFQLNIKQAHLWTPEDPYLYEFQASLESADMVESYFGVRCFTSEKDENGTPRFFLNHKPYFLNGVLDQGYWPEGLYTAPSDEALIFDIQSMKELGFNMLRKHMKIEPARWYYHCDRLGMIVWQDMVSGGRTQNMTFVGYLPTAVPMAAKQISDTRYASFGRQDVSGRAEWKRECIEMVQLLKNTVCIAVWVPFNEGWGQFQTVSVTEMIRAEDRTRLIDSASGWYDQACGDFNSEHNYFRKLSVKKDPYDRIYVLSEYGGYAHLVEGHSFSDRIYGYKKFDSLFDWNAAVLPLFEETVRDLAKAGMAGAVYTQLSDVEDEVNGILTYDRKVCKLKKRLEVSDRLNYDREK